MKKIMILAAVLITSGSLQAQDCKNFFYLQNNKVVEMSIYNRKGKPDGKCTYTVQEVKKNGSTVSSKVKSEIVSEKGKQLATATTTVKCTGGVMMMNMSMFIPAGNMQQVKNVDATANAVYLDYPANLQVGSTLPDGHFKMNTSSGDGLNSELEMDITERKAVGKESVTSPAGTWECFKITYHSKLKIKVAGIGIPVNMDMTEWFAPGFGVVKTESKYGSTLITAIR